MIKSYDYITCPNCGREFLVEEIFLPNELYSYDSINGVVRDDSDTKIIIHKGGTMHLDSTYTCDKCDTLFRVKGNLSFSTETLYKCDDGHISPFLPNMQGREMQKSDLSDLIEGFDK